MLIDKDGFGARVARLVAETADQAANHQRNDAWLLSQCLTHLLVGVGRHARGERISGRRFVKEFALGDLLQLLARHVPPGLGSHLDSLDAYRRFELGYPVLAEKVNAAMEAPTPRAAIALLDLLEAELSGVLDAAHKTAIAVVRARINEVLD